MVASAFEVLDASNAKQAFDGRVGVFVDYVADRVGDLLIFGSIASTGVAIDDPWITWLAAGTLVASFLASYMRAEAGALRLSPVKSHVGRAERIVIVLGGLFAAVFAPVNGLRVAMGLTLVLAVVTMTERFYRAVANRHVLPPPFAWAPDEFIPRLVADLGGAASLGQEEVMLMGRDPDERVSGWVAIGSVRLAGGLPQVELFGEDSANRPGVY